MSEPNEATGSAADDAMRDDQQPANQSADNLDTSEDTDETPGEDAGDAEGDQPEGDAELSDEDKAKAAAEADTVEVEAEDGTKHRIPKSLHGAFLRQADYSRKTAEAAAIRRDAETRIAEFEAQKADSLAQLPEEHAKVALVKHQIASVNARLDTPVDASGLSLRKINWPAYRAAATAAGGEDLELYQDRRAAYEAARADLTDLTEAEKEAKQTLSSKEAERLASQQEAASAALAKAQQDVGRALEAEIKGWSPERAVKLLSIAKEEFGVTPYELERMTDVRQWRLLDAYDRKSAELAKTQALLKKHNIASGNERAQQSRPATSTATTGSSARKTTDASGDGLSTAEWMRRENERVAAKRRA